MTRSGRSVPPRPEGTDRGHRPAVVTPPPAPPGNLAEEVERLPRMTPPPSLPLHPAEIARRRAEQFEILAALERGELIEIPVVSFEALTPKGGA
jgi:hypothetical protein